MLNKKVFFILSELRQNARQTLKNLSKKTKIAKTTLRDVIISNEKTIINKYIALLDFRKIGFPINAHIVFETTLDQKEKVFGYVKEHHHVNSAFVVNSGNELLIEVLFTNFRELEEFEEDLESRFDAKNIREYYVVEEIKREEFMNDMTLYNYL